jgi:hypothetical protein
MRRWLTLHVIMGWLFIVAAATAGGPPARSEALFVALDHARMVDLSAPADSIILGNPALADVSLHSARALIVTGKSTGQTNLIVLDRTGHEIAHLIIRVGPATAGHVAVFRGGERQTLLCAPVCQPMAVPGDDPAAFDAALSAATRKLGMGAAAASAPR